MIKFEHTVFAMPFALIAMLLAARAERLPHGLPTAWTATWIVVAMVGARSAAMAFNRLADAVLDARNPRTASRALPTGLLSRSQVWAFTVGSIVLFEVAALALNPLCLALSPVALAAILGYSYTKRFTALSHLALGFGIGLAPVGAWMAVTGRVDLTPLLLGVAVMLWIAGFDVIYALQDEAFDRSIGLRSLPSRLGPARALAASRAMHLAMVAVLVSVGLVGQLHSVYYIGVACVAGLIAYEQSLVAPNYLRHVNLAFFTLNGWISVGLLVFVAADLFLWAH